MEKTLFTLKSVLKNWKIIFRIATVVLLVGLSLITHAKKDFATDKYQNSILIPTVITAFFISWLIRRLSLLIDEWPLKNNLHDGSLHKLLSFVFADFHMYCPLQMVACGMFYFFAEDTANFMTSIYNQAPLIFFSIFLFFLKKPENIELSIIMERDNLNIGQGLAEAYYYNYLKLIFQSSPGSRFVDRIEQFERTQDGRDVRVKVLKKLIILLPKSCYIPDNLEDSNTDGYPKLQRSRELPTLCVDIGGIKTRPYNNTVYGVHIDEKSWPERCVVEGATPLKTLYDMSEISSSHLTETQRLEQLKLFYHHLDMLLKKDPECCNSCVLLFYNDRDENGYSLSLARIILDKIQEINHQRALG